MNVVLSSWRAAFDAGNDGSPEELRLRPGLYRDLLSKQYGKGTTLHVGGKKVDEQHVV